MLSTSVSSVTVTIPQIVVQPTFHMSVHSNHVGLNHNPHAHTHHAQHHYHHLNAAHHHHHHPQEPPPRTVRGSGGIGPGNYLHTGMGQVFLSPTLPAPIPAVHDHFPAAHLHEPIRRDPTIISHHPRLHHIDMGHDLDEDDAKTQFFDTFYSLNDDDDVSSVNLDEDDLNEHSEHPNSDDEDLYIGLPMLPLANLHYDSQDDDDDDDESDNPLDGVDPDSGMPILPSISIRRPGSSQNGMIDLTLSDGENTDGSDTQDSIVVTGDDDVRVVDFRPMKKQRGRKRRLPESSSVVRAKRLRSTIKLKDEEIDEMLEDEHFYRRVKARIPCAVCTLPNPRPYTTPCGHIFCQKCLQGSILHYGGCPCCRHRLTLSDMHRIYL